jgi:tetratricopeptide (TPR) repeat protein
MRFDKRSIGNLGLAMIAVCFVTMAILYGLRSRIWPRPTLERVATLLSERRFDDAERDIRAYLRYDPRAPQANLLMAQCSLLREPPRAQLALDHLARIAGQGRELRAIVLLNEGKAYSALGRNDRAEAAWKEALRIAPGAPEVGWDLLGLYYVQGRRDDARQLAMALYRIEPDPRDRPQLLLELLRQDAQPIGPDSLVRTLGPLALAHPEDLHTGLAYGLALVRSSRLDEGLAILRERLAKAPQSPDAWNALLLGLDEGGKIEELVDTLDQLPRSLAPDARFDRFRAIEFQHVRDWPSAANAYLRAWYADPSDMQIVYRLTRALKAAGRGQEAEAFERRMRLAQETKNRILPLYEEANAVKDLGIAPHPDLYHRLADLREHMGRCEEAMAWHRLVLRDQADDPISREAVSRLATAMATLAAGMSPPAVSQ